MKNKNIIETYLEDEMHDAFLEYSEEFIENRAIPNVQDGLKPVQRRILYAFYDLGITYEKSFKKSARIVGDVLGKWHPHGDSSVYDAMVRLGQPWNQRYPLVCIYGNQGSADGDKAAAMRYTEAKASQIAGEFFKCIEKGVIDWEPNFDDSLMEPSILPTLFPNYLVNGGMGIASGVSCDIPPHNLSEVISAINHYIDTSAEDIKEYLKLVKGPDFPTGGVVEGKDLESIYKTGLGKVKIRAKYDIESSKSGRTLIVFTETPYQKKNSLILERIIDLIKKKELVGVTDLRDESSLEVGIRIVVEAKKETDPNYILKTLFQKTDLETTHGIQMRAIVDGRLKTLSLVEYIKTYLDFQKEFIKKAAEHDLKKAYDALHIQEGFLICLDNIDKVVLIIKNSKDSKTAKSALENIFRLTDVQAQSILDLRLSRLTSLGKKEVDDKIKILKKEIKMSEKLTISEKARLNKIKEELLLIDEKYKDKRKSKIVKSFSSIDAERPVSEIFISISDRNIKTYQTKNFKQDSEIIIETNDAATILLFNKSGQFYKYQASKLPLKVPFDVVAAYELNENDEFVFISKQGMVKRTIAKEFDIKRETSVAIKLEPGDELLGVFVSSSIKELYITSTKHDFIIIPLQDIPIYGRATKGVKSIRLDDGYIEYCLLNPTGFVLETDKGEVTISSKELKKQPQGKTHSFKKISPKKVKTIKNVKTV